MIDFLSSSSDDFLITHHEEIILVFMGERKNALRERLFYGLDCDQHDFSPSVK
jgi:hypothetical protein